ncbi:hypothetical protein DICPUDRAFT_151059, partial [Dictyostelium purpureum]
WFNQSPENNNEAIEEYISTIHKENLDPSFLFQFCMDDHQKKVQFIKDVVRDIKDESIEDEKKLHPVFFFNLVVGVDDLKLIELALCEIGSQLLNTSPLSNRGYYYRCIRSKKVLEYLIRNVPIENHFDTYSWYRYGSIDLLEHYESLIPQNSRLLYINQLCRHIYTIFKSSFLGLLESSLYVFKKPKRYHIDSFVVDFLLCFNDDEINCDLSPIHFIIENTRFNYNPFQLKRNYSIHLLKLFEWIYRNRYSDLEIGGRCMISLSQKKELIYLVGGNIKSNYFKKDFQNQEFNFLHSELLIERIIENSDLKMLNLILITIKNRVIENQSINNEKILSFLFHNISKYSKIDLIQYIEDQPFLKDFKLLDIYLNNFKLLILKKMILFNNK